MMNSQEIDQRVRCKIRNQLVYLHKLKTVFTARKQFRNLRKFAIIQSEMKRENITTHTIQTALLQVIELFEKNNYKMMEGFNAFLPFHARIEIRKDESLSPPILIACKLKACPGAMEKELNQELSKIIDDTEEFVKKVQDHCLKHNFNFTGFTRKLSLYRRRKLDPKQRVIADEGLNSDLNELFEDRQKDLLTTFHQLRFPDYLSVISFRYDFLPAMQWKLSNFPMYKARYHDILKQIKSQPDKWERFNSTIKPYYSKLWNDGVITTTEHNEYLIARAEVFEGQDDYFEMVDALKHIANYKVVVPNLVPNGSLSKL